MFAQPVVDALASAAESLPAERLRAATAGDGILGRLVPELAPFSDAVPAPPASTPAVERSQSFASVTGFLRGLARAGPVLVTVDDLQRAGRSTVELLHYLARHLGAAQVLLAAAARTGEGEDVVDLLRGVGTTVPLGPLPVDAVALLAGRAGHEARAADVMRRTGGHPLFVVEVLRSLAGGQTGLPASLQAAVVDRVAGTGEETGRVLRAAAVLGAAFDPLVAGELAGVPAGRGAARLRARVHRPPARGAGPAVRVRARRRPGGPARRDAVADAAGLHARAADLLVGRSRGGRAARGGGRGPAAGGPRLAERRGGGTGAVRGERRDRARHAGGGARRRAGRRRARRPGPDRARAGERRRRPVRRGARRLHRGPGRRPAGR